MEEIGIGLQVYGVEIVLAVTGFIVVDFNKSIIIGGELLKFVNASSEFGEIFDDWIAFGERVGPGFLKANDNIYNRI